MRCQPISHRYLRATLVGALCVVAFWLLMPTIASAHAHLIQADPVPDGILSRPPAIGSFLFDEPLNPALTRVRVTDGAGRSIAGARGYLAPGHNDEMWRLPLPRLGAGTYSVVWTSESATDGHVMSSFYTFRVAPTGSADRLSAVTPSTMSGDSSGAFFTIETSTMGTVFFIWIVQVAQALWLGALVVELVMLARARRSQSEPEAYLARIATPRVWSLGQLALAVTGIGVVGQIVSLALQGTSGDWRQAVAPATLGGIFASQNGQITLARLGVLLVAVMLSRKVRVPVFTASTRDGRDAEEPWYSRAAALVAPAVLAPDWRSARFALAGLAALYMLLVALSGHAANVSPLWLSVGVDWLHLVCTAAWLGGIAVLAFGVMPGRHTLTPERRVPAVLPLVERFSPIAYAAVGTLAISGFYNAVSHLHQPSMVGGTIYGHLLLIKLVLVGLMLAMSAAHVHGLRPLMARAQQSATLGFNLEVRMSALSTVHEGLATLAGRLRAEAIVGVGVLFVTALMSQTLPAQATSLIPMAHPRAHVAAAPSSITGTAVGGDLRATLTVSPPIVGAATFALRLWEQGRPLTGDDGAAIIHLYTLAQPMMRAVLNPVAHGAQFAVRGSLAATGTWRADIMVRTALHNEYRTLSLLFTAGPHAAFLSRGPARNTIRLTASANRDHSATNFIIAGLPARTARLLVQSREMADMGEFPYAATPLGQGRWRVATIDLSMGGHWVLLVQARQGGHWVSLRRFTYSD